MMRFFRSAFVIARRDFSATVLSKTFIFFLLGPLFPLLFGGVFGSISAGVATRAERPVIAVVAPQTDFARLAAARKQVASGFPEDKLVRIVGFSPEPDEGAQQKRLLASRHPPVSAVLIDGFARPRLIGNADPATIGQLRLLLATAQATPAQHDAEIAVEKVSTSSGSLAQDRVITAQIGQIGLFLLTLMLSTMVLSQLIEEKSNKVIEVIAAAIPIDAMFVGKLFAMLSASVLGLVVWIGSGALIVQLLKTGGVATLPSPAVGWTAFLALAVAYFAMNYLLFGAAFLMIGAQASTAREVQTLSMPVTFGQVLIFGFAASAVGDPNSAKAIAAAVFPLSSPMTMLARAAQDPSPWPHLVAILWQAGWVALIIWVGARLFRKTVLKSGPRSKWWRLGRA